MALKINLAPVVALLWSYVESLLTRIANQLWDGVWEELLKGIEVAERAWIKSGKGEAKKSEVVAWVMGFIETRARLSWVQRQLVRLFLGHVATAIVDELNEELGHNWVEKAKGLEVTLSERLPVIE